MHSATAGFAARAGLAALALVIVSACSDDMQISMEGMAPDEVPTVSELNNAYIIEAPAGSDFGPQRSYVGEGSSHSVSQRVMLEGSGTILDEEDFERFGSVGFYHQDAPFVTGGVSYEPPSPVVIGPEAKYGLESNAVCNNGWTPLNASVPDRGRAESVDLLGFDIRVIGRVDPIDVEVFTTGGTYALSDLAVPAAPEGRFFGFAAPSGETITGFRLRSLGSGSGACADNVVIGSAQTVVTVTLDAPDALSLNGSGDLGVTANVNGYASGNGVYPVAVLSDDDFDASTLDATTAVFGPDEAPEAHDTGHLEDVDDDGDLDMVLHFGVRETGIRCGDTEATLTAETADGTTAEGTASFETKGCRNG